MKLEMRKVYFIFILVFSCLVYSVVFLPVRLKVILPAEIYEPIEGLRLRLLDTGPSPCEDITYNLTRLSKQNLLLYNMVPKCSSASLREMFHSLGKKLHYSADEGYYGFPYHHRIFHHDVNGTKKVIQEISHYRSFKQVFFKHFHFINFTISKERTPYYINIIRDPVDHYISWYYYRRYGQFGYMMGPLQMLANDKEIYESLEWLKGNRTMSFDKCVQSWHEECLDSNHTFRMIPFFCGMETFCIEPSEKSLNTAKENVIKYFPVVGYTENLHQFYELAEVIWPQFFKGAVGRNKKNNKTTRILNKSDWRTTREPSQMTKDIMAKRMNMEYRFYNWIKQRFQCMYDAYVGDKSL